MSGTASSPRLLAGVDLPSLLPAALVPGAVGADDDTRRPRTARDWVVDVIFFVLAIGIGAAIFATNNEAATALALLRRIDLVSGALCCLALWLRRRWPVGLALATAPIGAFSGMAAIAITLAMFTVAVHRRTSTALLVGALNLATTPIFYLLYNSQGIPLWGDLLASSVVVAAVLGWGMLVRSRRQLVISLRERAARAEAEQQARVEQARRTERDRIAREMHDVLAHRISLVSLHAGALEFRPDAPPAEIALAAGVIRANAREALQELRDVIGLLRNAPAGAPGDVESAVEVAPERPQPALGDLTELIEQSRGAGVRVRYTNAVDDPEELPATTGRTVYRIVQESLTNARKHAPGTEVTLDLGGRAGSGIWVEVSNPAPPAALHERVPGAGVGLIGLTERAALAGGRLEHGPTAAGGFRLRAELPWPAWPA